MGLTWIWSRLGQAADGIRGTLDHLGYRKVLDIAGTTASVGHERLADILHDFCDRWQIGVANLAKDGREIVSRLTDSVAAYHDVDQHNAGLFRAGG